MKSSMKTLWELGNRANLRILGFTREIPAYMGRGRP